MKKMSRVLALVLALALCFSCMAMSAFATGITCNCDNGCTDCDPDNPCNHKNCGNATSSQPEEKPEEKPNTPTTPPSSSGSSSSSSSSSKSSSKGYTPDVSGHYRTSANNIRQNVKPVEVAQQNLYIDPVTNSVVNLYDSMGNLIPCTLSSDGHFYIVPTNDGYVYIPTGK